MRVRWLVLGLAHAWALPLFAFLGSVSWRVVPDAPTDVTPVVIYLWGTSGDPASAPVLQSVRRDGTRIIVELRADGRGRISVEYFYRLAIQLGPLPAGDYEVTLRYYRPYYDREQLYPITFEVRDVTTLPVLTHVVPAAQQRVGLSLGEQTLKKAWLDDYELYARGSSLFPKQPPIPDGLYDLKVQWEDGSVDVARNAVQIASAPQDVIFGERLLVPVYYNGPDAAGMQWVSSLQNDDGEDPGLGPRPEGVFLSFPGGRIPPLVLRIRIARPGEVFPLFAPWTRVPLVRETEFRKDVTLRGVVLDPRKRMNLRVYSLQPVRVWCNRCGVPAVTTRKSRAGEPAFATIDLHPASRDVADIVLFSAEESPIWALVASTDTATGEIDIVTP